MNVVGLVLTCALTGSGPQAGNSVSPPSGSPDTLLAATIARELRAQGLVGAVWATVHGPAITELGAAGPRRSDRPEPLRTDDRVQVGSVAKTLVATGVLRLVSEGKLALDAPLEGVLPYIAVENRWSGTHPLRLRHLLDHTSGLDDARLWQLFNAEARPGDPLRKGFEAGRLELVVRHPPGERFSYSNTGYGLLGLVIERVTGQRYEAYLDANLLLPLGMTNSTFEYVTQDGPRADPRLAMGHFEEGALAPAMATYLRPAMQFTTTAADMARFARFLMSDGTVNGATLVDPALLRAMGTAVGTEAARGGLPVGYALGLSVRDRHGVVGRCHAGNTVGYRAMLCLYPTEQKAFFVAMNADNEGANYTRLDSMIIGTLALAPASRVAVSPAAADIVRWEGIYVPSPARFEQFSYVDAVLGFTSVSATSQGASMKPFMGSATRLEPLGGSLFRAPGRTMASHVFVTTSDGHAVLSDGLRSLQRTSVARMVPHWLSLAAGVLGLLYVAGRGLAAAVRRRLGASHPMFAPFMGIIGVLLAVGLLTRQSVLHLGSTTAVNVALAVATAALPLAFAIGLWRVAQARRTASRTLVAMDAAALVGVLQWLAVLAAWGLVPLRLWG